MNDQNQNNGPYDRREARRQRRVERREALGIPGGSTWVVGLVLIILGGVFLMQNLGTFKVPFSNWWALFILIPAFSSLERAYRAYQNSGGQFNEFVRNSGFVGVILLIVAGMFLFDISWTFFGPLLLILIGASVLINGMFSRRND